MLSNILVRFTVVLTSLYVILAYIIALLFGVDVISNWYAVMFEVCVVSFCFSAGKFHCRYMKYTALSILLCDVLTRLDNHLDFLTVSAHNLIPISILALGVGTSITLAIRHFIQVTRLKNARKTISNKKSGISHS